MTSNNKVRRIAIVGLGLIGGSLAMALKVNGYQIVGVTKKSETISLALARKAIDQGFTELNPESLSNVDLIFLCTPLNLIPEYIQEIAKVVKHDVILSDTGSTKLEICKTAKNVLPSNIIFIGGHPMAGTEKAGFLASEISLFKNCAWLLTPVGENEKSRKALEILQSIVTEIGAKPIFVNPEKHDQAVALVSHLPLLASIGLCQIVKNLNDTELRGLALKIASSGFRDTTRIGGGNPEMNFGLLASNFSQITLFLTKYKNELDSIINLAKNSPNKLLGNLTEINDWRSKLYNKEGKNALLN